eukprot:jgi/Ulvmu1/10382/UM061_0066.1
MYTITLAMLLTDALLLLAVFASTCLHTTSAAAVSGCVAFALLGMLACLLAVWIVPEQGVWQDSAAAMALRVPYVSFRRMRSIIGPVLAINTTNFARAIKLVLCVVSTLLRPWTAALLCQAIGCTAVIAGATALYVYGRSGYSGIIAAVEAQPTARGIVTGCGPTRAPYTTGTCGLGSSTEFWQRLARQPCLDTVPLNGRAGCGLLVFMAYVCWTYAARVDLCRTVSAGVGAAQSAGREARRAPHIAVAAIAARVCLFNTGTLLATVALAPLSAVLRAVASPILTPRQMLAWPLLNIDAVTVSSGLGLRGASVYDAATLAASATVCCIGCLGSAQHALAPGIAVLRAAAFWGGAAAYLAVLPLHSALPQLPAADVHVLPMLLVYEPAVPPLPLPAHPMHMGSVVSFAVFA